MNANLFSFVCEISFITEIDFDFSFRQKEKTFTHRQPPILTHNGRTEESIDIVSDDDRHRRCRRQHIAHRKMVCRSNFIYHRFNWVRSTWFEIGFGHSSVRVVSKHSRVDIFIFLSHFRCRFMGKVLTEKLLRDCPDIKAVYLLMRTKRGIEPEQRRDDYVNHMVSTVGTAKVLVFSIYATHLFYYSSSPPTPSISTRFLIVFVPSIRSNWTKSL